MTVRLSLKTTLCLMSVLAATGCSVMDKLISDPVAPQEKAQKTMELQGKGTQLFQCVRDAKGLYWKFVSPQAELVNANGVLIVRQGADFSFFAKDGSMLAAKITRWDESNDRNNLRDVLFTTQSRGKKGTLTGVRFVQRLDGKGGMPLTRCSPSQLGSSLSVPFSARYVFFK